jgi:hypothetical protein
LCFAAPIPRQGGAEACRTTRPGGDHGHWYAGRLMIRLPDWVRISSRPNPVTQQRSVPSQRSAAMPRFIVRYRVRDYAAWKPAFDAQEPARAAAGILGHALCRDARDPNLITLLFQCESLPRVAEFVADPALRKAMETAGVIGSPEFSYLTDLETKAY